MASDDDDSSFECEVDMVPLLDRDADSTKGGVNKTCTPRRIVCQTCTLLLAVGLIFASLLFLPWFVEFIYQYMINHMMVLNPKSRIFDEWAHPSLPMYQSFYFFDLQNPDEIIMGQKPQVKEKGPYVYRVTMDRDNITFNDNDTMSFVMRLRYFFDEDRSVGPESDSITALNAPLMTAAYMMKSQFFFIRTAISGVLYGLDESLTIRRTIREMLWGYPEPIIDMAQRFDPIPGFDSGQFGFYVGFNGTNAGLFNVYTGNKNRSQVNHIDRVNGQASLNVWWSDEANELNRSTDGSMYHPDVKEDETLHLYQPQLCRSISYEFVNETAFKGITLLKFSLAPSTYMNASSFPPNSGFCSGKPEICGPSGVMRQDPCRFGSPVAISNPHFLGGQQTLVDAIDGLSPNASLHENYIGIEPKLGVPFNMKFRIQMNMYMEPVHGMKDMGRLREMYLPLLWIEQSVEADDKMVTDYKLGFVYLWYAVLSVEWLLFGVGILLIIYILANTTKLIKESSKDYNDNKASTRNGETSDEDENGAPTVG